ncbi:MAG: type I glyceraldehyde-3-phosphate dehydrogenase [Anaerolineae bacterium]
MTTRVAINGFGRIGRQVLKIIHQQHSDSLQVVAIGVTDPSQTETRAHLLKHDSTYGAFPAHVEARVNGHINAIYVDGQEIRICGCNRYGPVPFWGRMGVDLVIEATGLLKQRWELDDHLRAGAHKVIVTAPTTGADVTIVWGVNQDHYHPLHHHIISASSCTTNCLAPIAHVLHRRFGLVSGLMTTVHAYTNSQRLLDKTHPDPRRARAAAVNIIPTTTGASKEIGAVLPTLGPRMNGTALRVPVPAVSLMDLVAQVEAPVDARAVNDALREAAQGELRGILKVCDEPLVSSDFIGDPHSAIVDAAFTMGVGQLIKVSAWYDNEWGYACRVVDLARYVAATLERPMLVETAALAGSAS